MLPILLLGIAAGAVAIGSRISCCKYDSKGQLLSGSPSNCPSRINNVSDIPKAFRCK